jgi:hypothetical protein
MGESTRQHVKRSLEKQFKDKPWVPGAALAGGYAGYDMLTDQTGNLQDNMSMMQSQYDQMREILQLQQVLNMQNQRPNPTMLGPAGRYDDQRGGFGDALRKLISVMRPSGPQNAGERLDQVRDSFSEGV